MIKAKKGHIFNENCMSTKTEASDYLGSQNLIFGLFSKVRIFYR